MAEHQELTSQSPAEQLQRASKPLPEPEVIKQPETSPLISKISEVRASAKANLQKVNSLLSGEVIASSPADEASQTDARLLLKELTEGEELSPDEYFQKSRRALAEFARLRKQVNAELEEDGVNLMRQEDNLAQTEQRLRQLDQRKGVRRISAAPERLRLSLQRVGVQKEIEAFRSQAEAKKEQLARLLFQGIPIRQRQEKLLLEKVGEIVQAVKSDYEELLNDILEDGTIPKEIRNLYIQRVISPKVEEIVKLGKLPESKKEEFYKVIDEIIENRDGPQDKRAALGAKLNKLFSEDGFWQVQEDCQPLLQGTDEKIVKQLVAILAAEDIAPIKAAIGHYCIEVPIGTTFEMATKQTIMEAEEGSFGGQVWSVLSRKWQDHPDYPDMRFWQALKDSSVSSKLAFDRQIFVREDECYYKAALNRSLEGHDINILINYPTPDAIRNLVLLASTDEKRSSFYEAKSSLGALAKSSGWEDILNKAEEAYPSLKDLRELLVSWNNTGQSGQYPDIQEAAQQFALGIFESSSAGGRLHSSVIESLTNSSRLAILAKRGVLPEQEAATLKNASALLEKISVESWEMHKGEYGRPFMDEPHFRDILRKNLSLLLSQPTGEAEEQGMAVVKKFNLLSQAILGAKQKDEVDHAAIDFLTNFLTVNRIMNTSFKVETLPVFLTAYQNCPELLAKKGLHDQFCQQFEGEQTVTFFKNMVIAKDLISAFPYQNHDIWLVEILRLVGKGALSQERALELPVKARAILSGPYSQFSLATEFPQLFLETDEGLEFFTQANSTSLFSLDKGLDLRMGERIRDLQREGKIDFLGLLKKIATREIKEIDKLLSSEVPIEVNQQNWQQLLLAYSRSQAEAGELPKLSQISAERIKALFNDPKVRDFCLKELRDSWYIYLKSGKSDEVPFSLNLKSELINYCGAGQLSQVESLNLLIVSVNRTFLRETTAERTKLEISQGLARMEDRFNKEGWSNDDRTDFYNISRDILTASPSLFSDYLSLFEKLTPSQVKLFAKELYPLYRVKLVLIEKRGENGSLTYSKEQFLSIRKDIRNFAEVFNVVEKSFENQKQQLLEEIRGLFKDRFGIIKIPHEFSVRSLTNISTYLANLTGRNADREAVLGFYLSLMLNDRWEGFRRGEAIVPSEYLTPEKSSVIDRLLQERQRLNPLTSDRLGITKEEIPEFLKLLQQETQNMVVGNVETVDVKLTNIILNLRGLEDPDLYPDSVDRQRLQLLTRWGNKRLGSVVARMYQSLANPERSPQFSEEETRVQQEVAQAVERLGLSLTPQTLKEYFQDGIKPLAAVANLLNFVGETKAESEIGSLRELLRPSPEVIRVFERLGEGFKPTSGAMALSSDLNYLDNLVVKREDELTPEEKTLLLDYTAEIRERMIRLEDIYGQIKSKFDSFRQGNTERRNPLLQEKLDQIGRIVNAQTTQQAITSTVTNDFNTIIENMRECLACTREGSNNDTNLAFGDSNKFYVYSQSESQKEGSISDQIVFVEPISRKDGSSGMAFVLDRIYGVNTPVVLENQVEAVLKKYRVIKQRFPDIRLFVFIPDNTVQSGGTSAEMISEKFRSKKVSAMKEQVTVDVIGSTAGDHYIEFGGNARTSGKREVNGLLLSL